MLWYTGSIPQAINEAKRTQKIFLVFLEGQDEQSQKMVETYSQPDVVALLQSCLAIKLAADSEQFRQFSQIYPVALVPSSFFIGLSGVPLEVVAGQLDKEPFMERITAAVKLHQSQVEAAAKPAAPLAEGPSSSSSTASAPVPDSQRSQEESKPAPSAEVPSSSAVPVSQAEGPPLSAAPPSLEEKVERAKQLMEKNREMKKKSDLLEERQAERERRRQGQELALAQKARERKQFEETAREIAREREEARLARERVKMMIEQDKAERRAASQQLQAQITQREEAAAAASSSTPAPQRDSVANIQFRLPHGASLCHQFPADSQLKVLHDYVRNELQAGLGNFTLATSYPRHHFTADQMTQSLRDLLLAPSATLLVLPSPTITSQAVTVTSGGLGRVVWFVLLPFINLWGHLTSWLSGRPPAPAPQRPQSNPSASSPQTAAAAQAPQVSGGGSNIRHRGNVYHLADGEEDQDDDNNTWNGNSTQQM